MAGGSGAVLVNVAWFAPAYAESPPTPRAAAAIGSFPAVRDASCGTLLRTGAQWPPTGPDIWLYDCNNTPDIWPYVAYDAEIYWLGRGFVSFDTSSIPASSTIASATLRLTPRLVMLNDASATTLEVVSGPPRALPWKTVTMATWGRRASPARRCRRCSRTR